MSWKQNLFEDTGDRAATAGIQVTRGDRVLLFFVVVTAIGLFFVLPRYVLSGATEIEIRSGDRVVGTYPLSEDRRIEVPGKLGTTVVRIKGGRAHIESSPCPHGFCTRLGDVSQEGGAVVCIPNEVVVQSLKERADGLDAVTR